MIHDLILALVFLGMIVTPGFIAVRPDRNKKGSL